MKYGQLLVLQDLQAAIQQRRRIFRCNETYQ